MGTRGPMGSRGSVSECFRGPRCTRESAIFGRERQIPAPRSKDGRGFEQKVAGKLSTVCAVNVDEAFSLTRLWNIDIFGPWPSCAFHEEKWKKNKREWIKGWINAIVISLVNNAFTFLWIQAWSYVDYSYISDTSNRIWVSVNFCFSSFLFLFSKKRTLVIEFFLFWYSLGWDFFQDNVDSVN